MNWREGWASCPQEFKNGAWLSTATASGLALLVCLSGRDILRCQQEKLPVPGHSPQAPGAAVCPIHHQQPPHKPGPERERERAEAEDSSTWQRWKVPSWVAWSHCEADRWLHFLLLPLLRPFPLQLRTTWSFNPQHFSSRASPTAKEPELLWRISQSVTYGMP